MTHVIIRNARSFIAASTMLAAALASTSASAASVTATLLNSSQQSDISTFSAAYSDGSHAWSGRGGAGPFTWHKDSATAPDQIETDAAGNFITFCIEFVEHISYNNQYTYAVVNPAQAPANNNLLGVNNGAMGGAAAVQMSKWFGAYYDTAMNGSLSDKQAFQIGLWEIVYESIAADITGTPAVYDNFSGAFTASTGNSLNVSPTANAATVKARSWLTDSTDVWKNASGVNLIALTSTSAQDQITIATPSPTAIIPGIAGLFVLAGRRRRRHASADAS